MKLRLIGPPDIVRGWARRLRDEFGIEGREYASRRNPAEIRYYADLDDRLAAEVAESGPDREVSAGRLNPPT